MFCSASAAVSPSVESAVAASCSVTVPVCSSAGSAVLSSCFVSAAGCSPEDCSSEASSVSAGFSSAEAAGVNKTAPSLALISYPSIRLIMYLAVSAGAFPITRSPSNAVQAISKLLPDARPSREINDVPPRNISPGFPELFPSATITPESARDAFFVSTYTAPP